MIAAKWLSGQGLRFPAFPASRQAAPWFWPIGYGHKRCMSPLGLAHKHLLTQYSMPSFPFCSDFGATTWKGPGSQHHCVVGLPLSTTLDCCGVRISIVLSH